MSNEMNFVEQQEVSQKIKQNIVKSNSEKSQNFKDFKNGIMDLGPNKARTMDGREMSKTYSMNKFSRRLTY